MKKGESKLELERKRKKELHQAEEVLEATGQESESKARKWVRELSKKEEKEQKQIETRQLETLNSNRNKEIAYRMQLLQLLHDFILELKMPKNFSWAVWFDGVGVRLAINTPDKYHARAFRPSYSPTHDLNACYLFYYWAEKIYHDYQNQWLKKSTLKH